MSVDATGDDPNDPSHRDFDLSEAGGPAYHYEIRAKPWYLRRWFLLAVAALLIIALVVSILPR